MQINQIYYADTEEEADRVYVRLLWNVANYYLCYPYDPDKYIYDHANRKFSENWKWGNTWQVVVEKEEPKNEQV